MDNLIYVYFAMDGREIPESLPEEQENAEEDSTIETSSDAEQRQDIELGTQQMKFWTRFVDYCNQEDRGEDIASRKPLSQNWYDIPVSDADFQLEFTLTRGKSAYTYSA